MLRPPRFLHACTPNEQEDLAGQIDAHATPALGRGCSPALQRGWRLQKQARGAAAAAATRALHAGPDLPKTIDGDSRIPRGLGDSRAPKTWRAGHENEHAHPLGDATPGAWRNARSASGPRPGAPGSYVRAPRARRRGSRETAQAPRVESPGSVARKETLSYLCGGKESRATRHLPAHPAPQHRQPRPPLTHLLALAARAPAPPNRKRLPAPPPSASAAAARPIADERAADARLFRTAIGPPGSSRGLAGKRHVPACAPSCVARIPAQKFSQVLGVLRWWAAPARSYCWGRVGAAPRGPPRPRSLATCGSASSESS